MKTTLNPYLGFNGNAREAMEFYKSVLGGELSLQTMGESGMPAPEEIKDHIMHAQLTAEGINIMASDGGGHKTVTFGDNVSLSLVGSDEEGLTEIFKSF